MSTLSPTPEPTRHVRFARRITWASGLVLFLVGLSACASAPKRLVYATHESTAVQKTLDFAVWAPRDLRADERLPLVIFLHGGGDGADCFDEAGLGQHLDQALAAGRIPRVVIVVPNGERGFWENWKDGSYHYRDWVLRELMPRVQARYHTQACPEGCHVMGVSMGGYGSLRFALLHPELFNSVSALSAPIFDTERMLEFRDSFWAGLAIPVERIWGSDTRRSTVAKDDLFERWKSQEDLQGVRLLFAWGSDDRKGIIRSNRRFHQHLESHNVQHTAFEFEGPHKWTAWTPVIERALQMQVGGTSTTTTHP